jgi:hypothetical protein
MIYIRIFLLASDRNIYIKYIRFIFSFLIRSKINKKKEENKMLNKISLCLILLLTIQLINRTEQNQFNSEKAGAKKDDLLVCLIFNYLKIFSYIFL